uniref:Defensin-like protein n=1 Tax=Strongyloides venezuelensis TaxID=75913 RepID=A0A0K0FCG6_STRVS
MALINCGEIIEICSVKSDDLKCRKYCIDKGLKMGYCKRAPPSMDTGICECVNIFVPSLRYIHYFDKKFT